MSLQIRRTGNITAQSYLDYLEGIKSGAAHLWSNKSELTNVTNHHHDANNDDDYDIQDGKEKQDKKKGTWTVLEMLQKRKVSLLAQEPERSLAMSAELQLTTVVDGRSNDFYDNNGQAGATIANDFKMFPYSKMPCNELGSNFNCRSNYSIFAKTYLPNATILLFNRFWDPFFHCLDFFDALLKDITLSSVFVDSSRIAKCVDDIFRTGKNCSRTMG